MKIYSKAALEIAQSAARDAVKIGVEGGGEFDWGIAITWMKIATGHAPAFKYEQPAIQEIIKAMEGE